MTGGPSRLDLDKLRKVRALMTRGATAGERQAARTKVEAVAARAGMTLAEALPKLDAAASASSTNFFAGFDDWMEAEEPGRKAAKAERLSARECKRLARCRKLLAKFDSEEAVFAETEHERLLRLALEPLEADWHGMDIYGDWISSNPTPAMWEAIARAYPLPSAVPGVWAELSAWEALVEARIAFVPDYDAPPCIRARQAALEHLMDTMRPRSLRCASQASRARRPSTVGAGMVSIRPRYRQSSTFLPQSLPPTSSPLRLWRARPSSKAIG